MATAVRKANLNDVVELREQYRLEANCQIVRYTNLSRGFAYPVVVEDSGRVAAYSVIRTTDDLDTLIEFYAHPPMANYLELARQILKFSGAQLIEAQTNIPGMVAVLKEFGSGVEVGPTLFAKGENSKLEVLGATFRPRRPSDVLFPHTTEPEGEWVIECRGTVVATGGYFSHYNPPYVDLYMEVEPGSRRKGFGSFLLQELQKDCAVKQRIPAARCNANNVASAACLQRAGMVIFGHINTAHVRADL
ncbi:MAG: GNAT family N-acetyltransferase [bacterium]